MLAKAVSAFRRLPRLMRAALAVAVAGALLDIGHHLGTPAPGAGHGPMALIAHLAMAVGMLVAMIGLIGAVLMGRPAGTNAIEHADCSRVDGEAVGHV